MKRRTLIVLSLVAVSVILLGTFIGESQPGKKTPVVGIGNVDTLKAAYARWESNYTKNGWNTKLVLPLSYSKALSVQCTKAHGRMALDLIEGTLKVKVADLPAGETFDVWLVDNRPGPGHSVKPEPGDATIRVGTLKHDSGVATIESQLKPSELQGFQIDLVVVAKAGNNPGADGLLFGSPSLFQRIYHSAQRGQFYAFEESPRGAFSAPLQFLVPAPAYAEPLGEAVNYEALCASGEQLFFNQKFGGNGRTCATCHPADNNFTIDPLFIATLPSSNALFVAETKPQLAALENPELMRKLGLILENVDGFDNPGVMRGVPHTLALSTSLIGPTGDPDIVIDGETVPLERTGWSGDGAPGLGTLRDFATGAVTQHFPKTLDRVPGVDFRLPTDGELDAMEAFQLSLGRQEDPDLSSMVMKGEIAERGRQLFLTEKIVSGQVAGKCNSCHSNGGANASPLFLTSNGFSADSSFNFNLNIGVQNLPDAFGNLVDPANNPPDGGFGKNGPVGGPYGDGTFNVVPLIEAPDTGPYFHNNTLLTLESVIAFYLGGQFNGSPGVRGKGSPPAGIFLRKVDNNPGFGVINTNPTQDAEIGAFLRVLNTLENIRSAIAYEEHLKNVTDGATVGRVFKATKAEITDGIEVLGAAQLHPDAINHLVKAGQYVDQASGVGIGKRRMKLNNAIAEEELARELLVY